MVECSPSMHEVLSSTPSTIKTGCGAHLWSLDSGGGSRKIGSPKSSQLDTKFETVLVYSRSPGEGRGLRDSSSDRLGLWERVIVYVPPDGLRPSLHCQRNCHSPSLEWSDLGRVWWYTLVISALGLLRQDPVFVVSLCCEFWANLGSWDPFHQRQAIVKKSKRKKRPQRGLGHIAVFVGKPQSTPPPRAQNTGKVNPCVTTKMYTDFTSTQVAFHICGVNISGSEILPNRLMSWLCGSECVLLIQGTRVPSPEPTCRECKENQLP